MGIQAQVQLSDLFGSPSEPVVIPGLSYIPNYIDEAEELALINNIDQGIWLNDLKRRVQHYGFKYDYRARNITNDSKLAEVPNWAATQCKRLSDKGIFHKVPDQVIVNEYEPGQGISPHVDCIPCFDKAIASLSLGSTCVIEFINPETKQKFPLFLEPRSLLVLTDDARYKWQHTIPQRKTDKFNGNLYNRHRRLSLTFRNVILAG